MTDVLLPGGRDARGTLEEPTDGTDAMVVACPPHPRHGGSRSDPRLVGVGDRLVDAGVAYLRFDYGEWDEGYGEREDVRNAVRWARDDDRFSSVGVFGYSFGATLSLLASADVDVAAVAALAPTARLADDLDAVAALESLGCPTLILHGERDSTVDWKPVVDRARDRGDEIVSLPADHFFVGQHERIADAVGDFVERTMLESP